MPYRSQTWILIVLPLGPSWAGIILNPSWLIFHLHSLYFPPVHAQAHYSTTMTTQPLHHSLAAPLPPLIRPPNLQLDFFEGREPLDWSFQADQYFSFYQIPPEYRLSMVAFHMKGPALSWFKWMHQNNLLTYWPSFTRSLELRFGPSSYTNHQAELFKLQQHNTVTEYQTRFEKICNCVIGLSPNTILNYFLSGLQPEIRRELTILNPYSISQAIGLTKVIEDKLRDSKPKPFRPTSHTNPFNPSTSTPNRTIPTNSTPSSFPIKRLTPTQLQERRAQRLCYNCDEKFTPGHKCSTSRFLLLLDDPDTPPNPNPPIDSPTIPETHDLVHFHLSTQTFTRTPSPQTLKFKGIIHNLPVTVLTDSGSSHNILQPRIANHPTYQLNPPLPFQWW